MKYTLNQLTIFLKIVQTQSVTKASEALFLSQPAVSIQLKNFQDQFEIPLTEVIGRKIYITEFGYEIAEAAEKIIQQVQAIDYKTLAYKGKLSGKLKIAIVSTGKYIMPYFLADFMRAHAGIELIIDVTNKGQIVESLEKNAVDFALVSILPEKIAVEELDLLENKLYFVGSPKQTIKSPKNSMDFFQDLPIILRESGSGTRETMLDFFEKNGITIRNKMELTSNEAVKQAVIAGLGYSIMPLIGIKNELQNNELHIIPVKGLPITTQWRLIWLKGKKHAPISASLLNYLNEEKEEIVRTKFAWYGAHK
jgi:DNA-binding transcriptional LysR family regulator